MTSLGTKLHIAQRAATVGTFYLLEKARGGRAMSAGDVPASAAAITPEWLTAVLCKGVPGARVLNVEQTGGSSGTSERQGIALTLNDVAKQAGLPERLFTKSTTTYRQRLYLDLTGIITGEPGFYPQIRPKLNIETAKAYYAGLKARSGRSMVLLEDLVHTKGATFISTETYFSKEMMQDILADMAIWHAAFWQSPSLTRELAWLRTPYDWMTRMTELVAFEERCRTGAERAASVIPQSLMGKTDSLFKAMRRAQAAGKTGPQCFLHGDPHAGQFYITRDGRMGIGDWQIVMRGAWEHDYTYAVTTALTVEDRRLWETELLRFYLDRLQAAGGPALDFNQAWERYRQMITYGYCAFLFTVVGSSEGTAPEMQPQQVSMDIIQRTGQAIEDLEVLKGREKAVLLS